MSGGSRKFNIITILKEVVTNNYVVTNLRKFTKYEFFLMPFYRSIEGQPSNSMQVSTGIISFFEALFLWRQVDIIKIWQKSKREDWKRKSRTWESLHMVTLTWYYSLKELAHFWYKLLVDFLQVQYTDLSLTGATLKHEWRKAYI